MPSPLPTFLIVGAAKCGTTSLASYLRAHPQVHVPEAKELYFFSRDDLYAQGLDAYAAQFAGADGATAIGEATPDYMFFPWCAERIGASLPDVRLIACLRDPVLRAHSHYLHWYDDKARERRSFPEAIADELGGPLDERREDPEERPPYFGYVARGLYLRQLERLAALVGRERLHVVLLDEMERDPEAVFAGVCRFIGVDPDVRPENLGARENPYHQWRPAWLWRFMHHHRVFERLPRRFGRWLALDVMTARVRSAPPMDPATRERLAAFYAPHNAELARWLSRDLSHWGA